MFRYTVTWLSLHIYYQKVRKILCNLYKINVCLITKHVAIDDGCAINSIP